MIIGNKGVKYGLEVRKPKETEKASRKKPSVFGDEESDDEHNNVERQIARHAASKQADKKVADIHAAAIAEDPSVFDYDSHFDAIQEAREEPKRQERLARQSRYIENLLEKAEERKREQEIQYERRLAKEREAEDHLYGDKERFVTAAYKKKLEEDAKLRDAEKRKQDEEEKNAVEKKGHMGDFYRNLMKDNVAFGTARPVEQRLDSKREKISGSKERDGDINGEMKKKNKRDDRRDDDDDGIMPKRRAEIETQDEKKKVVVNDRKHPEKDESMEPSTVEQQQQQSAQGEALSSRRNKEEAVLSAKERYLERKKRKAFNA